MQKLIITITFSVLLLSFQIFSAAEDEQSSVKNQPSTKQMFQDSYTLVRRSAKSHWEIVKYLINKLEIYFFPPNLDFRSRKDPDSRGDDYGQNSAGETIAKAAGKSFQTGKVTVEESAKSAAKAMGEAAYKTAETMKGSAKSSTDDSHDEF